MKFIVEVSLDHPEHIDSVQNIAVLIDTMIKSFGPHYNTTSLSEHYKANPIPEGGRYVVYESRPQETEDILVRAFVENGSVDPECTAIYAPENYAAAVDVLSFARGDKP